MNKRRFFSVSLLCAGALVGLCAQDSLQLQRSIAQPPKFESRPQPNPPLQLDAPDRPVEFAPALPPPQLQPAALVADSRPATARPDNSPIGYAAVEDDLLPEERANIAVYERCNRSVVHISTSSTRMDFLTVSLRKGTGSGSVIDQAGTILTNQHVIEGAKEITVSLYNGVSYPAVLIGQDPETDVAILRIEAPAEQLEPISWGDSQHLRVGQRIYAIGNPFGLERSMSAGMISSLNRQLPSRARTMRSLIQVDMSLNQGNSGGPLLNTRGELIGMNAAIMSSNGDSAGVGFAIPASTIQRILGKLSKYGKVVRPTIGITRVYENERGLLIVTTARGGPAEAAGLKGFSLASKTLRQGLYRYEQNSIDPSTADLIQAIDGAPVRSADELLEIIENKSPGDTVVIDILRAGQALQVPIKLGASE
jgi:S1-C subfamily serine protease